MFLRQSSAQSPSKRGEGFERTEIELSDMSGKQDSETANDENGEEEPSFAHMKPVLMEEEIKHVILKVICSTYGNMICAS